MSNPLKRERKVPVQNRSRELVSAIFEASVRILKGQHQVFTTRNIAELAGVSIGSLYQYFPNKEALIGALIEHEARRHVELLKDKYAEIRHQSLAFVVEALVSEILGIVDRDKVLLRTILAKTFSVDRLASIIEAREGLITFVATVLKEKGNLAEGETIDHKAYMIVASLGGVVETIIFRKEEPMTAQKMKTEASQMVLAYCGQSIVT
jgi:AcrR family transcriptional regulator